MKPSFAVLLGHQGPYVQQSDKISLDKLYCHIEIQHTFIEMSLPSASGSPIGGKNGYWDSEHYELIFCDS